MRRATSLIHTSEITHFDQFIFNVFVINKTNHIHLCEDTDHVDTIIRTDPRATHVVATGDLVPAGTMLVTPALGTVDDPCF